MYYVLITRPCLGPPVVDRVCDTLEEAEDRFEEVFEDPANAGCWIEIAVRRVRRFRFEA